MSERRAFPESQLYFIYGNNEAEVQDARYQLVSQLLTPEERDSSLTEIASAGNQPLSLDRALSEILGELGTASFLADSKRVVVVYDLKELYETRGGRGGSKGAAAKKPKAKDSSAPDRSEVLLQWLRDELPSTGNVAIFVCTENEEKQKSVGLDAPLADFLRKKGIAIEKRDKPLQYEFEDQLLAGNAGGALALLRDWLQKAGSDSGATLRIYQTLSGTTDLLAQAWAVREAKANGIPESQVLVQQGFNTLGRVPTWKAKKIHTAALRHTETSIRELVVEMDRLQRLLYPSGEELYIPDWTEAAERIVVRLTSKHG